MKHDFQGQRAATNATFKDMAKMTGVPKHALVNFLFLADDTDGPFTACAAALTKAGFKGVIDTDEVTVEAQIGPIDVNADAIWVEEKRATEIAVKFGFEPDGWELLD